MSKVIFTVFQCKRVVLPYFFSKYSFPKMRESFDGEMEGFLIQHLGCSGQRQATKHYFETKKLPEEKLQIVQDWTRAGYYSNLKVISHSIWLGRYPSLPSIRIGLETSEREGADYLVWLEDDAILYMLDWNDLLSKIPQGYVGYFQSFKNRGKGFFLKSCWLILSRGFIEETKHYFLNDSNWNCRKDFWKKEEQVGFRLESALGLLAKDKCIQLESTMAKRIHLDKNYEELLALLKAFVPTEEFKKLKIDFPLVRLTF